MENFVPQKNMTESAKLDEKSILFIKTLLPDDVDSRNLETGGTLPNIDGFLDFLCPDGTAYERIVLQVKHLTFHPNDGNVFYDIPKSIYAYAERHPGEVVVFIASSPENDTFYWRYIDSRAIEEFKKHSDHIQQSMRYHFKPEEACTKENVGETVSLWKSLYRKRMASIKDEKEIAQAFASDQRLAFNSIPTELQGLANSHISRNETGLLIDWATASLSAESKKIKLLVGDAGVGKSVVIRDLIEHLEEKGVNCLCLKADALEPGPELQQKFYDSIAYCTSSSVRTVLIVDQIDALSQSLSSDRKLLNIILSVLLSATEWQNVRALVSCRKYDLEFDAVLSALKDKSEVVELGLLADEDVKSVLERLEPGLFGRIGQETLAILKNVQYLNTFCYLYRRNNKSLNYSSPIEIYDALWNTALDGLPTADSRDDAEKVLFSIADCAKTSGTLKPLWQAPTELRAAFSYLASNGILLPDGNAVSFMHQTFYDYVLARMYLSEHKSFIADIENDFQGLEIRSTVKAVLDFMRGHNETEYASEIQHLFFSEKIRFHIKLLAVSILATASSPRQIEKRIVKTICLEDKRLLMHFFKGVQSEKWFPTVNSLLRHLLPDAMQGNQLFMAMMNALSRYSFAHPEQTFMLVESIKDNDTRSFSYSFLINGHNDYRNKKVVEVYCGKRNTESYFLVRRILDAVQSNAQFGLKEAGRLLLEYLKSGTSAHDGYELTEVMAKRLSKDLPEEFLDVLHSVFVRYVRDTAVGGYDGFTIAPDFDSYSINDYANKLLEIYKGLIVKYSDKTKIILPIVEELISLNNRTSLSIAFLAIAEHPELHCERMESILADAAKIEKYLQSNVNYYFLQMLKAWYLSLDKTRAEAYQRRILSYESSADYIRKDKEKLAFPHLWLEKWILICNTLPDSGLIPEMKKCAGELQRRFVHKCIIEDPQIESRCYVCGGLVNNAVYPTFSLKAWLNSFLELDDGKLFGKAVSLSVHSDAFKKCVAANPSKFKDFVFELAQRGDIKPCYIISGIEGLLEAGIDYETMWPIASPYLTVEYAAENLYSFEKIAGYFLKTENRFIDQLFPTLRTLMNLPPDESLLGSGSKRGSNRDECGGNRYGRQLVDVLNEMLSSAVNSKQGYAMRLLCKLAGLPERRKQVYDEFTNALDSLNEGLRLVPLQYLYVQDRFDESLFFPFLKKSLEYMGPEALLLRGNAIQWCFYHNPEVVNDYISRIEGMKESHNILSQIAYYGLAVSGEEQKCYDLLERILAHNDEKVVATIVKLSMETFSDASYSSYARNYLERFASDGREKVVQKYCLFCDELPVEAFSFYRKLSKGWSALKRRDIVSLLKYVTKCIAFNPVECYEFIREQNFENLEDYNFMESEVVEVLLKIYGRLKEDEDRKALDEMMDMFDDYFSRGKIIRWESEEKV